MNEKILEGLKAQQRLAIKAAVVVAVNTIKLKNISLQARLHIKAEELENYAKKTYSENKLELEFDSKMKQLKKKEESLEEDLSYFLQQTDLLKEEVYRMAEGELPAEVHTYFFQMDENSERFRRDVFEQLDQIQEERRVGKECGLLGRSRWSPYHKKKSVKFPPGKLNADTGASGS